MSYYTDKISLWIMKLICCGAFLFAGHLFFLAFRNKSVLVLLVAALPAGLIASLLAVRYFLPGIAEKFTYSLLMPSRHLDKAPMILSPYYGYLTNGAYQRVIDELDAHPAQIFRDPEVVLIYAQACMNVRGREEVGLLKMESFFRTSRRENGNALNLQLLFFYADSARRFRNPEIIVAILSHEAKMNCYSEHEKRAILTRCAAMRQHK